MILVRISQRQENDGFNINNPHKQYKNLPGFAQRSLYAYKSLNEDYVWFDFSILTNKIGNNNSNRVVEAVIFLVYPFARSVSVSVSVFDKAPIRAVAFMIGFLANLIFFIIPLVSNSIYYPPSL